MKLINGDCIEEMRKIESGAVDLVIADIPYNEVNRKSSGLRKLDRGAADVMTFDLNTCLDEVDRVCNGSVYIFCGIEQVSGIRGYFADKKYTTRLCIYEKSNPSPMNGQYTWLSGVECFVYAKKRGATFNRHCKNTVFRFPTARRTFHPTPKPVPLMEELVTASSNEGDVILDFCMGSGTTGIACVNTNREFIGIELDKEYFDRAKERIETHIESVGGGVSIETI